MSVTGASPRALKSDAFWKGSLTLMGPHRIRRGPETDFLVETNTTMTWARLFAALLACAFVVGMAVAYEHCG